MSRNGPLALGYHALFVVFTLAPIAYARWPSRQKATCRYRRGRFARGSSRPRRRVHRCLCERGWALSSTFAVGISVPAALAIGRYSFLGRDEFTALFMSPLMIPHMVLGVAFLRFFTQVGLGGTMTGLILSHIVVIFPFALRLVLVSVFGMDRSSARRSRSGLRTSRPFGESPSR
jgi:putative spermidine/putrescine transport system permease protein